MDNNNPSLDSIYFGLADGTRRQILSRLADGPASVSELAQPFPIALPSLLKHLGVLERAGLVASRKRGRTRTCWLRPAMLAIAEAWLQEQRHPRNVEFV